MIKKETINALLVGFKMIIKLNQPIHIMLPKTSTYVKSYDGKTKWMYFFDWRWWLIREWFNTIWDKISYDIKIKFDSEPVYNKKYHENQNKIFWWWSYRFL